jgi:hypothetical protein
MHRTYNIYLKEKFFNARFKKYNFYKYIIFPLLALALFINRSSVRI